MEKKEHQEVCFICRHIKKWHKNGGSCSQPTCMCNCFTESNIFSGEDAFDIQRRMKNETLEKIDNWYSRKLSKKDVLYGETVDKLKLDITQTHRSKSE